MWGRNLENQQRAAAGLTTTGSCPLCSNAPHEHQDNADEEERIVRQLRQRVAILLVRDNVNMFDSRTPSFPQAVIDADVDNNY